MEFPADDSIVWIIGALIMCLIGHIYDKYALKEYVYFEDDILEESEEEQIEKVTEDFLNKLTNWRSEENE